MNNIYIIIITVIIIIILFLIFLFQKEITIYFMNVVGSSNNNTPSDCPDYWIKYTNHKNSSTDDSTYGCYIDAIKEPDVVYNGGRCNYINGVRTNFGTMPNYCDLSQNNAVGDNLNLTDTRSGIQLINGWQSFFKMENLPAVISISPQQNQSWVPGITSDGSDVSANDHLELRYVALYKISSVEYSGNDLIYILAENNPIPLSDTTSFSGPSYTMTGTEGFDTTSATILNNYGYTSSSELDYPNKALTTELSEFYKNIYRCNTVRLSSYIDSQKIACPTTWKATVADLPVDTSYVLIYVGGYAATDDPKSYVVSIYDKLTKSYITKQVANTLNYDNKIYLQNTSNVKEDFTETLMNEGSNFGPADVSGIADNLYIGYINIYIPYYHPNTSDGSHNTVAGYDMNVFDNLNYCQKRMWAKKNDIHWSGITDNPNLTKCSEDDFFSPVNFDVSFSLTAELNEDCAYNEASGGYYDKDGNQCVDLSSSLITSISSNAASLSWADITNF